ncbi:MAG: hypothetical protein P4L65_11075 [Legionella sp.]|nr:hypothetical protein [Legionella sp.]
MPIDFSVKSSHSSHSRDPHGLSNHCGMEHCFPKRYKRAYEEIQSVLDSNGLHSAIIGLTALLNGINAPGRCENRAYLYYSQNSAPYYGSRFPSSPIQDFNNDICFRPVQDNNLLLGGKLDFNQLSILLHDGIAPERARFDFLNYQEIHNDDLELIIEAIKSPKCPQGLHFKFPPHIDRTLVDQVENILAPTPLMKSIYRLRDNSCPLFERIMSLLLQRDNHKDYTLSNEEQLELVNLCCDLAYLYPHARKISHEIVAFDEQYRIAKTQFEEWTSQYDKDSAQFRVCKNLSNKLTQIKASRSEDTFLFAQVLFQSLQVLRNPLDTNYSDQYRKLSSEVSKRSWGKIILGAMLAISSMAILALCFATAFVTPLALPIISWGLNYLIPVSISSGIVTGYGMTLFAKNLRLEPKAQMDNILTLNSIPMTNNL